MSSPRDKANKPFVSDVCNDYIEYMQCMADSPEAGYTLSEVENLVSAWKDIDDEAMLESACGIALKQAAKQMQDFEYVCEVPQSALEDDTIDTLPEDRSDDEHEDISEIPSSEPDQDVINAISGQTNASGSIEFDTSDAESSNTTQDDEIV